MPRNKNNNNRRRHDDVNVGIDQTPASSHGLSQDSHVFLDREPDLSSQLNLLGNEDFIDQDGDARSMDQKISDLSDIFVGDNHVDRDVIETVLDGCQGDVNKASEKLFEMATATNKLKKRRQQLEENDLAMIACSFLDGESLSQNNDCLPSSTTAEANIPNNYRTCDTSISTKSKDQRRFQSTLTYANSDSGAGSYNFYNSDSDIKPLSDSKLLFKTESHSQKFLSKNSFEDMARNMEHNAFVNQKTERALTKGGNYFNCNDGKINNSPSEKSSAKFDKPDAPFSSLPSNLNNISTVDKKDEKNSFLHSSIDGISGPVSSLFSNESSSQISEEWDAFYKELNLEAVSENTVSPEVDLSNIASNNNPLDKRIHASTQKDKNLPTSIKTSLKSKSINDSHHLFSVQSSPLGKCSDSYKMNKEAKSDNNVRRPLSAITPEFIPLKVANEKTSVKKNIEDRLQPLNPLKTIKGKGMKTVKKKLMNSQTVSDSSESYQSQDGSPCNSSKNWLRDSPIDPDSGPFDPFGWGKINDILSAAQITPKPQPQRATRNRRPDSQMILTSSTSTSTTTSMKEHKVKSTLAEGEQMKLTNSQAQLHVSSLSSGASELSSLSSSSLSLSSQMITPGIDKLSSRTTLDKSPTESDTVLPTGTINHAKSLSSRLPPSLAARPSVIPPSTQTFRKDPMKSIPKDIDVLSKAEDSSISQLFRNKVKLLGVKTPIGILRHYLQQEYPVFIILRGLPGSGKSYLARQLMEEVKKANQKGTVLSTDDYFCQSGQYRFDRNSLDLAHNWNKQRALSSAEGKELVIIIDNTNTTLWELLPYAEMAIQYLYDVRVCEPDTPWKNRPQELSRKNEHNVPKDKIKKMKNRYEILTTEKVIQEACKSLMAKGKLPKQGGDKIVPSLDHEIRVERLQGDKAKVEMLKADDEDQSRNAKLCPNLPDAGLTDWNPSQEQRKPKVKSKKLSAGGAESNHPSLKAHGPKITLDFLNNSLKKAMVDMEIMQKESIPLADVSAKSEVGKTEILSEPAQKSVLSEIVPSGNKNLVNSLNFQNDGNVANLKVEEIALTANEHDGKGIGKELSPIKIKELTAEDENLKAAETYSSNAFPSADTHIDNECKQQKLPSMSKGISPEIFQNEGYYSLGPDSSHTSNFFQSSKNDISNDDIKEEYGDISFCAVNSPHHLSDENLDDESTTPVSDKDGHIHLRPGKNSMGLILEESEAICVRHECTKDESVETCTEVPHSFPSSESNDLKCLVHRLPSFTGSLVQYEDSEEESESENSMLSPNVDICVLEENTGNSPNKIIPSDETGMEVKEITEEICKDTLENGDLQIKVIEKEFLKESNVESSSGSLNSSRDQSPLPLSDASDSSSKKGKKKRVRKGRNPGPFLEESLVEESKSKAWRSFFTTAKSDSPIQSQSLDETVVREETPPKDMASIGVQCEPYYFSMVHRLNSVAFINEPVDLSACDVSVLQISSNYQAIHCNDSTADYTETSLQRKFNLLDKSSMTEDVLNVEAIDLYILQNCFPAFSRKYLEEVMSVCGNNLEWVTNHLIDSPPLANFEEDPKNCIHEKEEAIKASAERSSPSVHNGSQCVKSLAQMCREVVESITNVDPDDLELQVIQAGQKRLQVIEKFGKKRLLSLSFDEHEDNNGWLNANDFCYNYFSGPITPEECWEWEPSHIDLDRFNKPLYPLSPSSPSDTMNQSPSMLSLSYQYETKPSSPMSAPSKIKTKESQPFLPLNQSPFRFLKSSFDHIESTASGGYMKKKQLSIEQPQGSLTVLEPKNVIPNKPVLPTTFVHCLENLYGKLDLDFDKQGLILDDRTARKIYNCLKLQTTKTLRCSSNDEQLKQDEALARSLQEEEDAKIASSANALPNTLSEPSASEAHALSSRHSTSGHRENHPLWPSDVNSISHTLYHLRGARPRQLKPHKFSKYMPGTSSASYPSVWYNSPVKKNATVNNLHSIIEEEKAREDNYKKQVKILKAAGDADALATKLKRQELIRKYPTVQPELLEEIFVNNNYAIEATEKALEIQYEIKPVTQLEDTEQAMFQEALRRSQADFQNDEVYPFEDANFQHWPEDGEVMSYDDLRREAQMYRGLGKECQQKAQRYVREGMPSAAFFYRQEAKKYKVEEENANQRAASVLFERGYERLTRENTLDLHSYHLDEAIRAINSAISLKKEEYYQRPDRKKSYLNVITGRGLNSKGGIPKLKPGIINFLMDKNLKFEEKTSGMLKVYIFAKD